MRALRIDRRAGWPFDPGRVHRVVAVGMGDQDMRHGLAPHSIKQRRRVGRIVWAGIDDRDLAVADDVAHRSREGERTWIVAEDTPNARPYFLDHARLKRKVAIKRDVVGIGHFGFTYGRSSPAKAGDPVNTGSRD